MRKPLKSVVVNYFILCIACLLGCILVLRFSMKSVERLSDDSLFFNTGWKITVHDTCYENADISTLMFPVTSTNDTVVMENVLPETDAENPILRIYEWYSTIDVELGGRPVYSWGHDLFDAGRSVGCGWHFIETDGYPAGSSVKITLTVTEPRSFSSLKPVYFGDASKSYSSYFIRKIFIFSCSLFFVILGVIGFLLSGIMGWLKRKWRELLVIASCSFWLGVMVMHNNGCMVLITSNFPFITWMEHFSIICMDFSFLALMYTTMTSESWQRKTVAVMAIVFSVYTAAALILHAANIVHLPATRIPLITLIILQAIVAVVIVISNLVKTNAGLVVPSLGFLSMLFIIIIDLLRYSIVKYTSFQSEYTKGSLLSFGALLFLISMGVNYILEVQLYAEMKADDDMKARLDAMTAAFDAAIHIEAPASVGLLEDFEKETGDRNI